MHANLAIPAQVPGPQATDRGQTQTRRSRVSTPNPLTLVASLWQPAECPFSVIPYSLAQPWTVHHNQAAPWPIMAMAISRSSSDVVHLTRAVSLCPT